MQRTPHKPITPPREQIPTINHDRALNRLDVYEPAARFPRYLDLQAAAAVLEQQRDGPVVRVQAGAHAAPVGEEVGGYGWVVEEAEGVVGAGDEGVEECWGEVQG